MLIIVESETDLYVKAALDFLHRRGVDPRLGKTEGYSLTLNKPDPTVVADIQREREQRRKPITIFSALRRAS